MMLTPLLHHGRTKALAGTALLACCLPLSAQNATPSKRLDVRSSLAQDTLHLAVGQSILLHGDVMMKRVYVGNPAVISSFNSSPSDILVTAKEPGVSSLAVWDTNDRSRIYSIAADLDPTEMQQAVNQMYPNETVHVTTVGDRFELNGTVSSQEISDSLTKLGAGYSKQVANSLRILPLTPRQVELKLQIVEVDRTRLDQFGVNFTRNGNVPVSTSTGVFTNPLNLSIGYLKESINFNIQALAEHSILQILAEPTLTTLSGQPARFLSGGEFPVPVAQTASTAGTPGTITIQFRPYGVKVDFLPVVSPDGSIRLKIAPEVSTLDYGNAITLSGFTIPALSTRRAETEVELKDGQSFVLSGLLDHRTIENLGRVPGIVNIPVLGQLFRSKNNTHSILELVFIVTAKVVDPIDAPLPPIRPTPEVKPSLVTPFLTQPEYDHEVHPAQDTPPPFPNK